MAYPFHAISAQLNILRRDIVAINESNVHRNVGKLLAATEYARCLERILDHHNGLSLSDYSNMSDITEICGAYIKKIPSQYVPDKIELSQLDLLGVIGDLSVSTIRLRVCREADTIQLRILQHGGAAMSDAIHMLFTQGFNLRFDPLYKNKINDLADTQVSICLDQNHQQASYQPCSEFTQSLLNQQETVFANRAAFQTNWVRVVYCISLIYQLYRNLIDNAYRLKLAD